MLITMYRIICLALIGVAGLQHAIAADRPVKEAYEAVARLEGDDYVAARKGFLAREDARDFLQSRVSQTPDDWFAFALWQRITNKKFVDLYDRVMAPPRIKDPFAGRDFGVGQFDLTPWRNRVFFPRLDPSDAEDCVKRFDWMGEFALELEWFLRNPHGHSVCMRFWLFYQFCWGIQPWPITENDLQGPAWPSYSKANPYYREAFKTLDPDRMKSWLAYARDHEREPVVRLLTASRVPGKKSVAILEELSKEDSLVGTLAAFLYAGRDHRLLRCSGGHPFNGPWLDGWARRATPNQVRAARWIFASDDQDPGLNLPEHIYLSFAFPLLAVGPLIEHHPTLVGAEMKRRYHAGVESNVKTVKGFLEDYRAREDVGKFTMKAAKHAALSSMLWPKSAAAELKKINTTDRNARALIAKALEQLGQRTYPTGEDLQAMFGPEKEK